jgi:hypothetical protein
MQACLLLWHTAGTVMPPPHPSRVKGLLGSPFYLLCTLWTRGPQGYPWRHPKHMHISPQTDPSSTWPRERAI